VFCFGSCVVEAGRRLVVIMVRGEQTKYKGTKRGGIYMTWDSSVPFFAFLNYVMNKKESRKF